MGKTPICLLIFFFIPPQELVAGDGNFMDTSAGVITLSSGGSVKRVF